MGTKWVKNAFCKECGNTTFTMRRYKWDWDDKTQQVTACHLCDAVNTQVFSTDVRRPVNPPITEEDYTVRQRVLHDLVSRWFKTETGEATDVEKSILDELQRAVLRYFNHPYYSGSWDMGICVPLPNGGFQATGINDWTDFDNSGWREGFTMGEYKEWRKTIKREQDVEGDST